MSRKERPKGGVATVQIQMPFHAIVRSWTAHKQGGYDKVHV